MISQIRFIMIYIYLNDTLSNYKMSDTFIRFDVLLIYHLKVKLTRFKFLISYGI